MDKLASVKGKLECVFEIAIVNKPSSKRPNQVFMVSATDTLRQEAKDHGIEDSLATEKIDGTCVFITPFNGSPWLWARHDRKPKKFSEKLFRKFQKDNPGQEYPWDFQNDFKPFPPFWIPAANIEVRNGIAVPDDNGHTPGWVPVDVSSRQHHWHLSAVDLRSGIALQLKETEEGQLVICLVSLADIVGHTAELIGTFVNANPYGLGSKKFPLHLLVVHGSIKATYKGSIIRKDLISWLTTEPNGAVEGIVWHCHDGRLFKLHRFHVSTTLPWPIPEPALSTQRSVAISLNADLYSQMDRKENVLQCLIDHNGYMFASLHQLSNKLFGEADRQTSAQLRTTD